MAVSSKVRVLCLTCVYFSEFQCTLAFGLNPERQISQYAHTAWRIQDGFFNSAVTAITQTTDGYLWLGTQSGMLRFDGVRFVPWAPPGADRFGSVGIASLLGGSDGSLWIGGNNDGLWRWSNSRLTGYLQSQESYIGSIIESGPSSVWVTRFIPQEPGQPLCEVGDAKVRCFGKAEGIPLTKALGLSKDKAGYLWIGGSDAVLKWRPLSSTVYESEWHPFDAYLTGVTAIAPDEDGSAWIGIFRGGMGLRHLIGKVYQPLVTSLWDSRRAAVTDLLKDHHDALWVATANQGLYRIRNSEVEHFGAADGMSSDFVTKLFEDNEGDIWAATSKGLDVFRDLKVTTFSTREGLVGTTVDGILSSRDGTLWAASDIGLNALLGGRPRAIQGKEGLPGNQVNSLLEDHMGRLWVGVDNTMSIYQQGKFHPIKRGDGSPLGFVVGIAEDSEENVWAEIGGPPRELLRIRDLQVREVLPASRIPAARRIAADPGGGIWLGLMSGDLAHYRNGSLEQFHYLRHRDSKVEDIIVNPDGTVFAATAFGLLGWRKGRQEILTTRNGLPCDGVNALVNDGRGSLWLYTQCGLVQISNRELDRWWEHSDAVVPMRVLDALDGVRPGLASFQKAAKSPDGSLWFANGPGLQMIDPTHLGSNPAPPPVHVEEVTADRRRYDSTSNLHLPALTRDVSIRYTALSFVAPQRVRFRYRLDGQDKGWREADTRREAFYTNLGPGKYTFHVIACNNDGVWNEAGATWPFEIAPAFYQTIWFRAIAILSAGALFWSLYLLRLNQATLAIQTRLGERLSERERIARELHDTLLQGFSGTVLQFQAVLKQIPSQHPVHPKLEKALDRADAVMLEGRLRVRGLRSEETATSGIEVLVTNCGEELSQNSAAAFHLTITGAPEPLNPVARDEAYRIAREALMNAFLHSMPSKIEAEITYDPSGFRVRVRDDGRGIDPTILSNGKPGHWGLSGMRERAQGIGGRLNIWSKSGAGTEIELTIPANIAYRNKHEKSRWIRIKELLKGTRRTHERPEQD